ncbi:MAG: TIGR00159 family protein [Geobacteraceae bacterium]|nr:TIGR00159 family protein [Geobacteraceae bacterium]
MWELLQKTDWLLAMADILLVSIVIYQLLKLLRETTALRILHLLPLIIIASILTRLTGLVTFSLLIDNLLTSMFVILAVIFQYDIRRALLSFSRSRVTAKGDSDQDESESDTVLQQIADACHALSERRNGALIVIQREMSLDHFMGVGTQIDAKVTSEILTSIFLPYSPIHDGAVIIQSGKLTQAGCFLPLTQNPDIAKELGTRHRAAIGLTELVDALVIVVSEETGSVSVVSGGRITSDLESAGLRKLLRRMVELRWLQ